MLGKPDQLDSTSLTWENSFACFKAGRFLFFFSPSCSRESCESEDAASLPSSYPSSPTENGMDSTESRIRPSSKSTVEENAYEDIIGKDRPQTN